MLIGEAVLDETKAALIIDLGDGYAEKMIEVIKDELVIAKGKWRVFLSKEQEAYVTDQSIRQLEAKVQHINKSNWKITDRELVINISNQEIMRELIILPEDSHKVKMSLVRVNDGWIIETDNDKEEEILLENFYSYFLETLEGWMRTAVMYGVGSYKGLKHEE